MAKQKKHPTGTIAQNKKARHDYFIEHRFEAGLVLAGWEVKSLRASKLQLVDSYVLLKDGEAWLLGSHITPLTTASTHVIADPVRTRKLLLNARELDKLAAAVQQKGGEQSPQPCDADAAEQPSAHQPACQSADEVWQRGGPVEGLPQQVYCRADGA